MPEPCICGHDRETHHATSSEPCQVVGWEGTPRVCWCMNYAPGPCDGCGGHGCPDCQGDL